MYRFIPLLMLLCSLLPSSASASDEAELIALEIRNLSASVDRLTQLLYQQAEKKQEDEVLRKLDIAVAYLNFRSRRIEMLERDRQNNQSIKNRLEDFIQQMESRIEQLDETESTDPEEIEKNKRTREETQEQLKMMKLRLERIDEKLFSYDNQILELRNQLDDVEGFVERHLEL